MKTSLFALPFAALALAATSLHAQVITTTPTLPDSPPAFYASTPGMSVVYAVPGLGLLWLRNFNLCDWTAAGSLNAHATFQISQDPIHFTPVTASGPLAWSNNDPHSTGTFATELTQMDLSGGSEFGMLYLRESPTQASIGQTTVTDIGGGEYSTDSYFDVMPEISFDDTTWLDPNTTLRLGMGAPEPSATALLALGASGLFFQRLRRRQ